MVSGSGEILGEKISLGPKNGGRRLPIAFKKPVFRVEALYWMQRGKMNRRGYTQGRGQGDI